MPGMIKVATPRSTTPTPAVVPSTSALPTATSTSTNNSECPKISIPAVTLEETFLKDVKILQPVDGVLPEAETILNYSPKKRVVVGISGVSCGGKTTVSRALKLWLKDHGELIMQDDYYLPANQLEINPITNFPEFDEPEAVKMWEIRDEIKKWVNEPTMPSDPTSVLIVEGTMIFTDPEICALCDLRYLVHVNFEVAKYRRSLRNYPIPDPPRVVEKNIWPKYIKHREMFVHLAKKYGFISKQISGIVPVEHTVAGILQDVKVNKHR